jgi:P27 family predicted phage terminase small subunit
MKGGSRPKMAVFKKLHGSTEPIRPEPVPEGALGDDPAHFTPEQREVWMEAVRNSPPGILRRVDRSVLEVWTVAHVLHRQATEAQSKCGLLHQNGVQTVPSPLLAIINRTSITMMRSAAELGFTPASRPRLHATTPGGRQGNTTNAKNTDPAAQTLDQYLASAPQPAVN